MGEARTLGVGQLIGLGPTQRPVCMQGLLARLLVILVMLVMLVILARLLARLLVISVILARLLAILARLCQLYYRLFGLSWENILVIVEVVFTLDYLFTYMFFFRNRPPEKLPHQSCSTLRGEVDSSVPRVFGGF